MIFPNFELNSGYLNIEKKLFVQDMLTKESEIKSLIKSSDPRFRQPEIIRELDCVKLLFDNATDIELGESYQDYFKELKDRYKERITGRLAVRISSSTTYYSIIDLNGEKLRVY